MGTVFTLAVATGILFTVTGQIFLKPLALVLTRRTVRCPMCLTMFASD
ncbi:hypothetical protein CLOSTMETH_00113 [[Clostridium] methylpentosum DSM 5476]|uniref:Uncharacterized protein n=1 Tax=[Clostridium] methylpentosum DSM 5476 TaxID=537013 RepID=C0E8G8_9FIRM|nr:hypothetical protein CLOSTMETH_00113 [[Clostridium] methylpentosum DSM 5476]